MNWAHIHLIINHGPVVGSLMGLALLGGGLLWRSQDIVRAALVIFAGVGLLAAAVVQTGERAEEEIEDLAGVSETTIEPHEEAAELAAIGLEALGLVALVGLVAFRSPRRVPGWFALVVLLAAVAPAVLVARAANLGGQIRHPEITAPAAETSAPGVEDAESREP
jgi:hypothetical protein